MWEYDAKIKNMCKRFGFGVINERLLIYIEIFKKNIYILNDIIEMNS